MTNEKIAFVGGGNMTRAIVSGLLDDDFSASDILIAEPNPDQRQALASELPGVAVSNDNAQVVAAAGSVVLSVKPQVLSSVCKQLAETVTATRPLIISIAAGVRSADIDDWLGGSHAVVRIMPNQPALLRQGISGVYANDATTQDQWQAACTIMSSVGPVVAVESEADIDAVTAISGSGPAYFYLLIDIMSKVGVELGLERRAALKLALGTAKGAAILAGESDEGMDELVARVRSPGGTTAAALDSLLDQGVRDIFSVALTAARDRAVELADRAHTSGQE